MQYRRKPTHHSRLSLKASPLRARLQLFLRWVRRPIIVAASTLVFLLTISVLSGVAFSTSVAAYDTQEACETAGGIWGNGAPPAAVPNMGCSIQAPPHPADYARSVSIYNGLRACVSKENDNQVGWGNYFSAEDAVNGNWWHEAFGWSGFGAFRPPSYLLQGTLEPDGKLLCNKILAAGLTEWGYATGEELLCDAGIRRTNNASCANGTGDFDIGDDDEPAIARAIRDRADLGPTVALKDEHLYHIYYSAFTRGCSATPAVTGVGDRNYVGINIVDETSGEVPSIATTRFEGLPKGDKRWVYTKVDLGEVEADCETIAERVSEYAQAYLAWLRANPFTEQEGPGARTCERNPNDPSCAEAQTSCAIDGIGWIVCPVLNFLANIADNAYAFLADNFLAVNLGLINTDPTATNSAGQPLSTGTYQAWTTMRNIANVAFVIAVLVIVFSQLSNVGISNYGVKKMLPRLVIAAILVNLSFFVCQVLVDLSNILGYSLKDIFATIGGQMNLPQSVDSTSNLNTGGIALVDITILVLAGAGAIYLMLPFLLGTVLAAVVALLMIGFILIARQALIVLLIVVAPLAFVAYLFPNTESWFKKWQKAFVGLLMVFPIIGLVFGAAQLASSVMRSAAGGDTLLQIVAAATAVIPLFVVPSLLKGSLNAVGSLGAKINAIGTKAQGGASKKGADLQGRGIGALASSRLGRNQFMRGIGARATGAGGGRRGQRAFVAAGAKYENEDAQQIMDGWARDGTLYDNNKLMDIAKADPGSSKGQAAMRQLAASGSAVELATLRAGLDSKHMTSYNRAIAAHYGTLKSKDPRAVQDMGPAEWAGVKQADLHTMKDASIRAGIATDTTGTFERNVRAAMLDPEQSRHFTQAMYDELGLQRPGDQQPAPPRPADDEPDAWMPS